MSYFLFFFFGGGWGGMFLGFYFLGATFSCTRKSTKLGEPWTKHGFPYAQLRPCMEVSPASRSSRFCTQTHCSSKYPPILKPPQDSQREDWCSQVFQEHQQQPEICTVGSRCLHQHLATNSALIYLRQLLCLAITNSSQIYSGQDMKFSGLLFGQNPN